MTARTMCPHETPGGIEFVACDLPTVPAWMIGLHGTPVDHLYPDCQHIRHRQDVRPTVDQVCPAGSDLCGSCLRRWRARSGMPFPGAPSGPGRPQDPAGDSDHAGAAAKRRISHPLERRGQA